MPHSLLVIHDPDARLDHSWDWSEWLATDETIATQEILAPAGVTIEDVTSDGQVVTAWVTAPLPVGTRIPLTCRITTNQAREDDRTMLLYVQER